ncbi:MAG: pilus assembly protein N-terminal domain-containing protein [Desulfocapsa sp.]|nr:pilus assembly protein N-terminal domain-containing protein [Desulfocapsa sp.]
MTLARRKKLLSNKQIGSPILLLLALFLFVSSPTESTARETINMFLGEVKVLPIEMIERVAIGNPTVASNSILPRGQLVLLADSEGATTMHIWLKNGKEKDFDIIVKKKKVFDDYQQLVTLLSTFQGIQTIKIGDLTVVKGKVLKKDKIQFDRILKRYGDVLDLVTARDVKSEVTSLLTDIPNLNVREIGGHTVLSGEISKEFSPLINIIEKKYKNIMNLTRVHTAVAGKMIYMKIRIMELSKNITQQLGIKWGNLGIFGPSLQFGLETSADGGTLLNADGTSKVLTSPGGESLSSARGYFGISTGISSVINLSLQNGDGVILAEPQLSTRSGGKAKFHAGGEYPLATTSTTGQVNIEYKKYGIILKIEPVVDDRDNILAHIETEISNIDHGMSFGDYPGILTRNTSTDISLKVGETLVMAGLVQNSAHNNYDKIKWLGDVPILGPLFRSQDFQNQTTELVIFVTPYIYDAASSLNQAKLAEAQRIQDEYNKIVKGHELVD